MNKYDELHPELQDVSPDVAETIQRIKGIDLNNVREAINLIACKEKKKEVIKQQTITEDSNKTIQDHKNLVENIQKDIRARRNMTITRNEDITMENKEKIQVTSSVDREIGA